MSKKIYRELLINLALVYSIFIAILIFPYVIIRGFFGNPLVNILVIVYVVALLFYSCLWVYDKRDFIKDEFHN